MIVKDFLSDYSLDTDDINYMLSENPSFRGVFLGYTAEYKLRKKIKELRDPNLIVLPKIDDHQRRSRKSDVFVAYKGFPFHIECKSPQTNTLHFENGIYRATVQVDGSDKTPRKCADGTLIETVLIPIDTFDILAVPLTIFNHDPSSFAYCLNSDLLRSTKVPPDFLQSNQSIQFPIQQPFTLDLYSLLNGLMVKKRNGG